MRVANPSITITHVIAPCVSAQHSRCEADVGSQSAATIKFGFRFRREIHEARVLMMSRDKPPQKIASFSAEAFMRGVDAKIFFESWGPRSFARTRFRG